jgi:exodeoxyribonuclease V alpha subunit
VNKVSEFFRVTSIPHNKIGYVIFKGVPLEKNSYKTNSGKYVVSVKAKTNTLPCLPSIGQQWRVKGVREVTEIDLNGFMMEQHTYEDAEQLVCALPNTGESFIQFISDNKDFEGIGPAKARELWSEFEKDDVDIHEVLKHRCREHEERLRTILTKRSINALYGGYQKYKNLSQSNYLSKIKIPLNMQHRIMRFHDQDTVRAIKENPYTMLSFGMQFSDVDEIAKIHFEFAADNANRLSSAVEAAIRKEVEKGHTYTTQKDLRPRVKNILGCNELVSKAFMVGFNNAQYLIHPESGNYHPVAQLMQENVVAKRLLKLAGRRQDSFSDYVHAYKLAADEVPFSLVEKQVEAIKTSLVNYVSCITGGAGTGKTTVLRTVLRAYNNLGYDIHAVALSGRAAMRLHESIGFETKTIARLLKEEPIEPTIDQKKIVLVIDEASMTDLVTMYRIVTHIHPCVRIILSGDPNQLPPIGAGKVLADVVKSGAIQNTVLSVVKRQEESSGIPEYSMCVNGGLVPQNLSTGAITFHETEINDIGVVCTELYEEAPDRSRIMSATNPMVEEINIMCQSHLNSDGKRMEFELDGYNMFKNFRINDPILLTKNNYDLGFQNGSLGELTSVESSGESFGSITLDTGDKIQINQDVLDCMKLGYAITLHKAQGSQFPRIIIALKPGRNVDRAWVYTAITRAESEVHIVGRAIDFKQIVEAESHTNKRNSYLAELLSSKL